jgi:RecJ-like exonuclease
VRDVRRTPAAEAQLQALVEELYPLLTTDEVLRRAMPYTHAHLTHRFRAIGVRVVDGSLEDSRRLGVIATNCTHCEGRGTFLVYEECQTCHGEGCPACGGAGDTPVNRPCACTNRLTNTAGP